jgi:hypothetical protein
MRFVPVFFLLSSALGADADPAAIVRRSVLNDEIQGTAPEVRYAFTERSRTRNLDEGGGVRSASSRTREIQMADYQNRRDRYRKAIREIPEAFSFRLLGEEEVNSRLSYVVEATPRPGYEPVDRFSRLYTKVKGKLWIDKADLRWARIEAELLDTVTFGWILVRIHKGSRASLTQEVVNQEAWLPRGIWYHVSLRVGLVSLRNVEVDTTYGDYRPADSQAEPSPGFFFPRPALDLAQSTSFLTPGKYSLRMSSPGIMNIHPWITGRRPPMRPRMTNPIPKEIRVAFRRDNSP